MATERDIDSTLSKEGRSRQQRMRDELLAEMRQIHQRRRRRRHALAASMIMVLAGGLWLIVRPPQHQPAGTSPQLGHEPAPQPQHVEPEAAIRIEIVDATGPSRIMRIETDEAILDRYHARNEPLRFVTHLTDEQLVRELAAMGEPASIVHLPNQTLLVRAAPREPVRRDGDG